MTDFVSSLLLTFQTAFLRENRFFLWLFAGEFIPCSYGTSYEDSHCPIPGSQISTQVPLPGAESTRIMPPWFCTMP